jgi:pimeloyl-ACP methyl ester carboxylesterase
MTTLDPSGQPIRVGGLTLRTPGLTGEATARPPAAERRRAPELESDPLETALRETGVESQRTIELSATGGIPARERTTRSLSHGEAVIEVEVPAPEPNQGQLVLYRSESGVTTWHLSRAARGSERAGERTYVIRPIVASAPAESRTRGVVGAVVKGALKVLVFPLVDRVLGPIAHDFVAKWEKKNRPYRIRTFTPENFRSPQGTSLKDEDWAALSGERALLLVHGTFSRTDAAFGDLPLDYVQTIFQKYQGRVISFDHPTLSEDPRENAEWFVRALPDGASLELDIVCHSRGGLVSRMLAEQQGELSSRGRTVAVRKVIFVGTPNAGTPLTDTSHVGDFLDSYTNTLTFFPSTGVTDVLEAIVTVLKQFAVTAVKSLPGLQSMLPDGDFLRGVNQGEKDDKKYFALSSNFEPADPGLKAYAHDSLMDAIFEAENDLVVPTVGVYEKNGSGFFPIDEKHVFSARDGIAHTRFFADRTAREKILDWLSA